MFGALCLFLTAQVFWLSVRVFSVSPTSVSGISSATEVRQIPPATSGAVNEKLPAVMPPRPRDGNLNPFTGQDHAYSVTFRGNGQAVVYARVVFYNSAETSLRELSFRFSKVEPEGLLAYQIFREKQCVQYDYSKPIAPPNYQYPCLQYGEPNYLDYYGQSTYKKTDVFMTTDTVTLKLPEPVAPQKSGAVLIYFRAMGYAKKDAFGAYNYVFETLKVDSVISNLRVGISPDSDLYMKGASGTVDYFRGSSVLLESSRAMGAGAAFTNSVMDAAISNIGYGSITKYANNLMPLDSYKVEGAYADSRLKLYTKPILVIAGVSLVFFVFIIFSVWRLVKTLTRKRESQVSAVEGSRVGIDILISVLTSFASASLIVGLVFLAYLVGRWMRSVFYHGDAFASVVPIFAILVFIGLVGVFLLVSSIFVGLKRGVLWGLLTFGLTIVWLVLVFVVLTLIFIGVRVVPPIKIMM